MKAIYVGVVATITVSLWITAIAIAQQEITAGDIRAVLDGKYALTSEGYAAYRKCIASIPLGGELAQYTAAVEQCKETSKQHAFILPEPKSPIMTPESSSPHLDRTWQSEKLQKLQ